MTAELRDWSEEEYRADPSEVPSLTQSIATTLVTQSPLHAWYQHPRLGGVPRPPTHSMNDGTAVHELLLGGGRIVEVQYDDFRTKEARALRDDAIAAGRVPMTRPKLAELRDAAHAVHTQIRRLGFRLDGLCEQSVAWQEHTSCGTVQCRGRVDHLSLERGEIIDIKTARTANPERLDWAFVDQGLDVQAAAYENALALLEPRLAGRIDVVFLFCELVPPHAVSCVRLAGSMAELGQARWARARTMWAYCLRHDSWPGYGEARVEAPPRALEREDQAEPHGGIGEALRRRAERGTQE